MLDGSLLGQEFAAIAVELQGHSFGDQPGESEMIVIDLFSDPGGPRRKRFGKSIEQIADVETTSRAQHKP